LNHGSLSGITSILFKLRKLYFLIRKMNKEFLMGTNAPFPCTLY
jgi:hypothetical protein